MQGDELRALRKAMGVTQEQFAKAIGMSRKAIIEMEAGKAAIELRTKLAALYLAEHHPKPHVPGPPSDAE